MMLRVLAGRQLGLRHVVLRVDRFGRFAVVVAGLQRGRVGLGDLRLLAELVVDVPQRRLERPIVQPEHQAHREEVAAAVGFLLAQSEPFDRQPRELGHRRLCATRYDLRLPSSSGLVS